VSRQHFLKQSLDHLSGLSVLLLLRTFYTGVVHHGGKLPKESSEQLFEMLPGEHLSGTLYCSLRSVTYEEFKVKY
jgi:hypothetical protein